MNLKLVGWALVFIVVTSFFFVAFHEMTHVAMNGFRWTGEMCFLNCPVEKNTIAGVWLTTPFTPLSKDERVADIGGFIAQQIIGLWLGIYILKNEVK